MKTTVDREAARELELYAENTARIYHQNTTPAIENLRKKYKRGQYDHEKAARLWEYVAESAARLYVKEFCPNAKYCDVFSAATRRETARALAEYYREDVEND